MVGAGADPRTDRNAHDDGGSSTGGSCRQGLIGPANTGSARYDSYRRDPKPIPSWHQVTEHWLCGPSR